MVISCRNYKCCLFAPRSLKLKQILGRTGTKCRQWIQDSQFTLIPISVPYSVGACREMEYGVNESWVLLEASITLPRNQVLSLHFNYYQQKQIVISSMENLTLASHSVCNYSLWSSISLIEILYRKASMRQDFSQNKFHFFYSAGLCYFTIAETADHSNKNASI